VCFFVPEWTQPEYFIREGYNHNPKTFKRYDFRKPLCIECHTNHKIESHGFEDRRALLEDDWCVLVCRRYECGNCKQKRFNGWDDRVVEMLPGFIAKKMEFLITHRAAIHKPLVRRLVHNLISGKGFDPTHEEIVEAHLHRFYDLRSQYCSKKDSERRHEALVSHSMEDFVEFTTKVKYNGYCSSVHYLRTVFELYFSRPLYASDIFKDDPDPESASDLQKCWDREYYFHRAQQMIDGTLWCVDGAYKVANLTVIRNPRQSFGAHSAVASSNKAITSIFTVVNQYEQIVFQKALVTNDPAELKEQVGHLAHSSSR
jgi:hypothetical protein